MLEQKLLEYGYWFIFVGTILEADATILAAGFLAHAGHFSLPLVVLVSSLSTFCANVVYFFIAQRKGRAAMADKLATSERLRTVFQWVEQRGSLLLFASRFMPGFRIVIPAACGATGMTTARFLWVNAVSAGVWAAVFGAAGYFGGGVLTILIADIKRHEFAIAATILVLVAAFIFWQTQLAEPLEVWLTLRHPSRLATASVTMLSEPKVRRPKRLQNWQSKDIARMNKDKT